MKMGCTRLESPKWDEPREPVGESQQTLRTSLNVISSLHCTIPSLPVSYIRVCYKTGKIFEKQGDQRFQFRHGLYSFLDGSLQVHAMAIVEIDLRDTQTTERL